MASSSILLPARPQPRHHPALLFLIIFVLFIIAPTTATCPTTFGEFSSFFTPCRAKAYQLTCLTATNQCTGDGPGNKFKDCQKTLTQLYTDAGAPVSCQVALKDIAPPGVDGPTLATNDCKLTFSNYTQRYCHPHVCPDGSDLNSLLPLANCLVATPSSLSGSALNSYSAYKCLQDDENTKGVPNACKPDSSIDLYRQCKDTTQSVVQSILGSKSSGACATVLVGPLTQYCDKSFGDAIVSFCTPKTCEQAFAGSNSLDMCTGIGVVVGSIVGAFVLACVGFILFKRAQNRKREQKKMNGSGLIPISNYSPTKSPGLQKQPSNLGLQFPAPPGMTMGSPQMTGMRPTGPAPVAAVALDPATLTMRKGQLVDFYFYHDPNREDIPGHVDRLFEKYSFSGITEAVRQKYKMVPSGWE